MIELENVSKLYGVQVALENLSLELKRGLIHGIIGPNGAGKTTLLKMIVGLLWPTEGSIRISGTVIGPKNIYEARLRIGYSPEEVILYERLKGKEFLEFICFLFGNPKCTAILKDYIKLFMLDNDLEKLVKDYSHGMKRKLSLLAAFVHDPDILILDEPTNGLDPRAIKSLKDVLLRRKNEDKITVISTHILDMAEYLCDIVTILDKGRHLFSGSLEELRKTKACPQARLEELFLKITEV